MSPVTVVVSPVALARAFEKARNIGSVEISGVAAPASAVILGLADEAWSAIETALNDAYDWGIEKVSEAFEYASRKIDDVFIRAGVRFKECHRIVLDRLSTWSREVADVALSQITGSIAIGGVMFSLTSIKCTQKLSVSGSIKASLKELLSLVANGELNVEASYGRLGTESTTT